MAICLDEVIGHKKVIGDPLRATMVDRVEEEAPRVGKTRKQKKNGSRAAKAMGAIEHMIEDASVDLADISHREKGLWAIDTANPNAWGGAAEILESSSADAIAIQETRVAEAGIKDHENSARGAGGT